MTFIPRFDTLRLTLAPEGDALKVTAAIDKTTLLWSATPLVYGTGEGLDVGPGAPAQNAAAKYFFTGRSDAYDPAKDTCNPDNGRLDSEGIRVSNDGKSVFISDEYGPYLYQFDRATGERVKNFHLPSELCAAKPIPRVKDEIAGNTSGRTTNKGMEGLAITPDGKTLVGVMQAALIQDAADPATKKIVHLVTVDIASGTTHEYAYKLTDGSGVSEILALNDHQFLVDERDGDGLGEEKPAKVKDVFLIDLTGAQEISGLSGDALARAGVDKKPVFNLVDVLAPAGIDAAHVPSKIEGLAFGPDVSVKGKTLHTLIVANDNDFLPETTGPNIFYVIGFEDADLPGYQPQAFVK